MAHTISHVKWILNCIKEENSTFVGAGPSLQRSSFLVAFWSSAIINFFLSSNYSQFLQNNLCTKINCFISKIPRANLKWISIVYWNCDRRQRDRQTDRQTNRASEQADGANRNIVATTRRSGITGTWQKDACLWNNYIQYALETDGARCEPFYPQYNLNSLSGNYVEDFPRFVYAVAAPQ